jgi:hypothetical protein
MIRRAYSRRAASVGGRFRGPPKIWGSVCSRLSLKPIGGALDELITRAWE